MSGYNLDRKATGGGVLVVNGTHFLDRLIWFWGMPDQVELEDDSIGGPEANCSAIFHYENKPHPFSGIACYSKTHRLPGGLIIETIDGVIKAEETEGGSIVFWPRRDLKRELVVRDRWIDKEVASGKTSFQLQLEDFAEACTLRRPPAVTGECGVRSVQLVEALYANRKALPESWTRRG